MKQGKDNRGTTLAEMIVTFALIGIFLVVSASVISSSVILHGDLTATMNAQSVGLTLLDKVTGELAAASPKGGKSLIIGDGKSVGGTLGDGGLFYDREGNEVCVFVKDGRLIFTYEESVRVSKYGEVMVNPSGEWKLEDNAYLGYQITDMQIDRLEDKNILEISIKIKNLKTGFEYTVSGCTKCYNFRNKAQYAQIVEGNILAF